MRLTRAELEAHRGEGVPDVLSEGLKLLFIGINPGLRSAAVGAAFAHRSNRFFAALALAGITDHVIDTSSGFRQADLDHLAERGIGITALVGYATAKASELSDQQLVAGRKVLESKIDAARPRIAAMLGVGAYRTAFAVPKATFGPQDAFVGESRLWVLPSPSGLNAHFTLAELAAAYREAAIAAGIEPYPSPTDRAMTASDANDRARRIGVRRGSMSEGSA
ncbi:mismatch-specific DNA-glycosylase [Agromyces protaetiae]|uniref:Mismatch-specific DNA-glycosylase n=1 Tax=Agromyces protaetiae TaxID=2509455 RepID=A0A4P6FJ47_9MICO|nr:mismatch-specific DNA-glycosylase [Agromyces protaetiae]QAY73997.1 mismatch-specific DNA-glycosylase [Agromyces protaetiae]